MIILKKTHEDYVQQVKSINPNIEVVEQYVSSKTKILHRCKIDNYQWRQRPDKILVGRGCPLCSGYAISPKISSLAYTHPEIALEWDYEKNENLLPTMVSYGSDKEVWWICQNKHSYKRRISDRTISGRHCSKCSRQRRSSGIELKVYYYIKKYFPDTIHGYNDKENDLTELDIYIPSLNVGIEYDGFYWHQDVQRDINKDSTCENIGIKLLRIREPKCPIYKSSCCFVYLQDFSQKTLAAVVSYILESLGIKNPVVDFNMDINEINQLFAINGKKTMHNDLIMKHPKKNKIREQYIFPTAKIVYCNELKQVFRSISNASKNTGVAASQIHGCLVGKYKSAGKHPITKEKLHWFFVEDQIKKDGEVIQGAISLGYITIEKAQMFTKLGGLDKFGKI